MPLFRAMTMHCVVRMLQFIWEGWIVKLPEAVDENLSFLLAELDGQLSRLVEYFKSPNFEAAQQLVQRSGYSSNLSGRVRKACLEGMIRRKQKPSQQLELQGIDTIARNLDLLSRLGRRAVLHADSLERPKLLRSGMYQRPLKTVRKAVGRIQDALQSRDSRMAVEIGQTCGDLDVFHDQLFRDLYARYARFAAHRRSGAWIVGAERNCADGGGVARHQRGDPVDQYWPGRAV